MLPNFTVTLRQNAARPYLPKNQGLVMDNFEQRWLNVETIFRERFGKLPDLDGMLFLIGINELEGNPTQPFTKEQKQDLMHIAVCTLLVPEGYYEFAGRDVDGWPHFHELQLMTIADRREQERLLKECMVRYFAQ